ncbi:Abscission/NoCut checkpoint regulator [Cladorrhinum sp. PSN259]|nr:Abscission/NoCut checkpoint regulator [Cladorrhinum sp. PSN259]
MPSDQSLLDRLNALKPTTINLERPSSIEDALASRLRSLRNQPNIDGGDGNGKLPSALGFNVDAQPPSPPKEEPVKTSKGLNQKVVGQALSPSSGDHYQIPPDWSVPANDISVEAYLESLGGQCDWSFLNSEEDDPSGDPSQTFEDEAPDPKCEAQKLTELLQKLRDTDQGASTQEAHSEDDDNSDGERMTRDVEAILSQARDEISLIPPEDNVRATSEGAETVETATTNNDFPLSLPSVPSQPPKDQIDDLAARLASLRGIGPVDAFGLPAAPTFQPDKRPSSITQTSSQSVLQKNSRNKYSDSDQSTWCWKEMHVGVRAGYEERGHRWVKFEKGGTTSAGL